MALIRDGVQGTDGLFKINQYEEEKITCNNEKEIDQDAFIEPFKNEIKLLHDSSISAILKQDECRVSKTCQEGHILKTRDTDGNSVGMVFAQQGRVNLLQCLHTSGYSLTETSNSGATLLHYAAGTKENIACIEWLASNGVDVNAVDVDGRRALLIAAYEGHVDSVEVLLEKGANVNACDKKGHTALMAAAQQGHIKVLEKLLENKADIMCKTKTGKNALFYACMKKQEEAVRLLLSRNSAIINHIDRLGMTVAMTCAANGNIEMTELLHSFGANFDIKNEKGLTALMFATIKHKVQVVEYLVKHVKLNVTNENEQTALSLCACKGTLGPLQILLKAGCDPNHSDCVGDTPLILSTKAGSLECVQALLDHSVSIDKQNAAGKTALIEAVQCKKLEICKLLHQNGASLELTSNSGLTAKELACASPEKSIREYFHNLATVDDTRKLFLAIEMQNLEAVQEAKHDLNITNSSGFTPLMVASGKGFLDIMKYLLAKGASVKAETTQGITAIACAVSYNQFKSVDLLIGFGADIDQKNRKGRRLLHQCVEEGKLNLVKRLAKLGADLELQDEAGQTPLTLASVKNHLEIVEYLVNVGASLDAKNKDGQKASECATGEVKTFLTNKTKEFMASTQNESIGRTVILESRKENATKLKELLRSKAPVNFQDRMNKGTTALMQACKMGYLNNVRKLCEAGAKTYVKAEDGDTPLFSASYHGHRKIVKYLLEKQNANPNIADNEGRTPLMCASQEGHQEIAEMLLSHEALVNVREKRAGSTALNYASHNGNIHVVEMLVNCNANIDQVDFEGRTVLTSVCLNGFIDIVECLIKAGADVNHQDSVGRTPLMAACQEGRLKLVQFLVDAGANISASSSNGMRVIDFAERKGHHDIAKWLQRQGASQSTKAGFESTTKIIDMEPDIIETETTKYMTSTSTDFQQKLLDVCGTGQTTEAEVKSLIKKGAQIESKDSDGMTPLLKAVKNGHSQIASWLLQDGADVNCKDAKGKTPLLHAVEAKDKGMIELLISYKADEKIMDNFGDDIFVYATKSNDNQLVMTLIELIQGKPTLVGSASQPQAVHQFSQGNPTFVGSASQSKAMHQSLNKSEDNLLNILCNRTHCNTERVRKLLDQTTDINVTDDVGRNALHYCAHLWSDEATEIAKILCNEGVNVDLQDRHGQTPLLECCQNGNIGLVGVLLKNHADCSVVSAYGVNALEEACIRNDCRLVHILLRACSWSKDSLDMCMVYALVNNFETMIATLRGYDIDAIENLGPHHFTDTFVQDLMGLGESVQELCIILAAISNKVDLVPESGQCLSDDIKGKALHLAMERGHYQVTDAIYRTGGFLPYEWIFVIFESTDCLDKCITETSESTGVKSISGSAQGFTRDEIELQACVNEAMERMYKIFTKFALRDSPQCIQGFSRSWSDPIIYIYAPKGKQNDATKYVKEKMGSLHPPVLDLIKFEYIEHHGTARFLALKSGSAVAYMQHELSLSNIHDLDAATITCFMFSQGTDKNSIWCLTVGHVVTKEFHVDNGTDNEGYAVGMVSPEDEFCIFSESFKSTLTTDETDGHLIDVAVFKVSNEVTQQQLIDMGIPGANATPDVFWGDMQSLKDRTVFKTGMKSGYTEGIVIDVQRAERFDNRMCTGLFVVKSETPGRDFADFGDSGAAVIDKEKGELVGMVIGIVGTEDNAQWIEKTALCLKLDYTLKYIEKEWQLKLSFNQIAEPSDQNEDEDNEDLRQIEQIVQRYKQMKVANKAMKQSLRERDALITLLRRQKEDLQRNLRKFRNFITRNNMSETSSLPSNQTGLTTQNSQATPLSEDSVSTLPDSPSITQLDERVQVYLQPWYDDLNSSDEITEVLPQNESDRRDLEETEIKCSVRPALSMTVSESLDSQIPAPIQEEYASDPEDAVLSSNELKSISVSGDEQASVDDVEGLDDNTEIEMILFQNVAKDEERELIISLNASPPQSLQLVLKDCHSSTSEPDSLAHYLTDETVTGYTILHFLKESSLKPQDFSEILKRNHLMEAQEIFKKGKTKELLFKTQQTIGFAKMCALFEGTGHLESKAQDIVDCEFYDQQVQMFRAILQNIKDGNVIQTLFENMSRMHAHRAVLTG